MPVDKEVALRQLNDALESYEKFAAQYPATVAPLVESSAMVTRLRTTMERLVPPGLKYADLVETWKMRPDQAIKVLAGVLRVLREDYAAGRLHTFRELVRSDLFSDFLEMAEYLLTDEGLKDPAAVIAGGVLEQHLRALCAKHGITIPARPKLDTMNAELAKKGAYGRNDQNKSPHPKRRGAPRFAPHAAPASSMTSWPLPTWFGARSARSSCHSKTLRVDCQRPQQRLHSVSGIEVFRVCSTISDCLNATYKPQTGSKETDHRRATSSNGDF
jgi:hypothetical protein